LIVFNFKKAELEKTILTRNYFSIKTDFLTEKKMPDIQCPTYNARHAMRDTEHGTRNVEHKTHNTGLIYYLFG